jgi:hypothetical protein
MGRNDIMTNTYLKKAERSADLINCYVCNGKQLVTAEDIRLIENVHYRVTEEKTTGITRKKKCGDKRRRNQQLQLGEVNMDLVEEVRFGMRVSDIWLWTHAGRWRSWETWKSFNMMTRTKKMTLERR